MQSTLPLFGSALILYNNDEKISHWVQDYVPDSNILRIASGMGDPKNTVPLLAGLYLYGRDSHDDRAYRSGLYGLESLALSEAITGILKFSTHRHRPSSGDNPNSWDGPGLYTENLSFPSGHSSRAFAVATTLALEYNDKKAVPPLMYGLASLTALSRVRDKEHWASDVFVGALVGYYSAKTVHRLRSHDHRDSSLSNHAIVSLSRHY